MSTLEIIVLVVWGVGGLAVGGTLGIQEPLATTPVERGFVVLMGWVCAPVVVVASMAFGVCWSLGHVAARIRRTKRVRPSREALKQRIRELEIETGVAN